MKKILVLLALTLFTLSCSNDDDTPREETYADLIGTWTITSASSNGEPVELNECTENQSIVFTTTEVIINGAYLDDQECTGATESSTYILQGNSIFVMDEEEVLHNAFIRDASTLELWVKVEGSGQLIKELYTKE